MYQQDDQTRQTPVSTPTSADHRRAPDLPDFTVVTITDRVLRTTTPTHRPEKKTVREDGSSPDRTSVTRSS